jgi:hypothetical protein
MLVARLNRRGLVEISRKGGTDAAEYRPLTAIGTALASSDGGTTTSLPR